MNSNDVANALIQARTFKPTQEVRQTIIPIQSDNSFATVYDELDRMDFNTFNVPQVQNKRLGG